MCRTAPVVHKVFGTRIYDTYVFRNLFELAKSKNGAVIMFSLHR